MLISFHILGFPMNVMALLPYLVYQYEEPNEFCVEAATRIAEVGLTSAVALCL